MTDPSPETLESVAAAYEERLVPAMFEEGARVLLEAAEPARGDAVLDLACGTGVLARAAAEDVGPGGRVAGLDLNPAMLTVAGRRAPGLAWCRGPAESLPFRGEAFDLVACQFSLMFFEDRSAAIREMFRVLAPEGRLVVSVFGALEEIPAYRRLLDIYERVCGDEIVPFLEKPFALSDPDELGTLFETAGLHAPHITTREFRASWPGVREAILADVEGWFPLAGIDLDEAEVDAVVERARSSLEPFVGEEGALSFPMPAHLVTNFEM